MANTTPNATITLYQTNFKANQNAVYEDLDMYLDSMESAGTAIVEEIKHQNHELTKTLKLEFSQSLQGDFPYNYCKIINSDDQHAFYYYILSVVPVSSKALMLTLQLDTLNSLGIEPRNFLKTTRIFRTHKDRFKKPAHWNTTAGGKVIRKIDKFAEEATVDCNTKNSDTVLESDNQNWYLMYITSDAEDVSGTLKIAIAADSPLTLKQSWTAETRFKDDKIIVNNVSQSYAYAYYYLTHTGDQVSYQFERSGSGHLTIGEKFNVGTWSSPLFKTLKAIRFFTEDGKLKIEGLAADNLTWYDVTFGRSLIEKIFQGNLSTAQILSDTYYYGYYDCSDVDEIEGAGDSFSNGALATTSIKAITELDRTNSKVTEVVCLPYCPIAFTLDGGIYTFSDDNWQPETAADPANGFLVYKYTDNREPELLNEAIDKIDVSRFVFKEFQPDEIQLDADVTVANESKLNNSQYLTLKATYDNYNIPILTEQCNFDLDDDEATFNLNQKTSSIGNSTFAFSLTPDDPSKYKQTSDYDLITTINRNNELPLYHNAYLNYMRTGYNYDKKANDLAVRQALGQMGANTLAAGIGASTRFAALAGSQPTLVQQQTQSLYRDYANSGGTLGPKEWLSALNAHGFANQATQTQQDNLLALNQILDANAKARAGKGIAISAAGAMAANLITSAVNIAQMKQSQELAMESKIGQLQQQATGISTNNDLQLLQWYNGNKVHFFVYTPTAEVQKALTMHFHRFGYNTYEFNTPDVSTRYWFNYIQCDPEISVNKLGRFKSDWIADFKERYNAGVTVFHYHNGFNIDQDKENYETWLTEVY